MTNPEFLKTSGPILVTEPGILIVVNLEQFSNVLVPILVRFVYDVNVTDVKLEQPMNAKLLINVTEAGMIIDVNLIQFSNNSDLIVSSFEPEANVTVVKPVQSANTDPPIDVTEAGISIDVKAAQ
jgi:hypothetical protein